jgi:transposase InsO family protein
MIVGGEIFFQDNAYNFQKVFHDAVETYGIPNKLYVDNGASYRNDQLDMICASIGTVLLHTAVRDGASKGKVERNFRTLKERWLYGLDFDQLQSLEELNRMLKDYIRQHNTTVHSAIKVSPLERYMNTGDRIRRPQSREWLEESFCNRIYRNVRRDATVTIDKDSYDVPFEFIGQRVEIRYLPDQKQDAYILQNGKRYPLKQTNKVENSRTKRQNGLSIDYSRIVGGGSDVS